MDLMDDWDRDHLKAGMDDYDRDKTARYNKSPHHWQSARRLMTATLSWVPLRT